MVPTGFHEENGTLDKPADMSYDQCDPLSVWHGVVGEPPLPVFISCWKLTETEILEVLRTKRVWLMVCGEQMPPVKLFGTTPFSS